jgi:hypothetical protein
MADPESKTSAAERRARAEHIVSWMLDGQSEIAPREDLGARRARQIVAEEIARRDANPRDDDTPPRIARLDIGREIVAERRRAPSARARSISWPPQVLENTQNGEIADFAAMSFQGLAGA